MKVDFMPKSVLKKAADRIAGFLKEEDGVGVVELILIVVVLIGLVIIFKTQLTEIVNSIFDIIKSRASSV